jgi:hypothetical protein
VSAEVGAGRYDQREMHVAGGTHGERGEIGVMIDALDTDGFPPQTASDIARGYDNLSGNAQGGLKFGRAHLGARYWQTTGTSEYLDSFCNRSTRISTRTSPRSTST